MNSDQRITESHRSGTLETGDRAGEAFFGELTAGRDFQTAHQLRQVIADREMRYGKAAAYRLVGVPLHQKLEDFALTGGQRAGCFSRYPGRTFGERVVGDDPHPRLAREKGADGRNRLPVDRFDQDGDGSGADRLILAGSNAHLSHQQWIAMDIVVGKCVSRSHGRKTIAGRYMVAECNMRNALTGLRTLENFCKWLLSVDERLAGENVAMTYGLAAGNHYCPYLDLPWRGE